MPYWRLSAFYLFYFASLGALVPYWSLYLKSLGFSSLQIGELMALLMATKIVSPNIWGWIADHTGRRMTVVRIGSLLAVLGFALVFVAEGYWGIALAMLVFSFFWNAVLPQFESTTLGHLGEETHRYSSIRLWGSVGFIITVAGLGPFLDRHGPGLLPLVLSVLFAGIFLSSLVAPERRGQAVSHEHVPIFDLLRKPAIMALLAVSFLMQASHGPYYTFYTIYMEAHGHSRAFIGQLWALGVVAEVVLFLFMHRMVPRYGLRLLLLAAFALTTLRWLLIGFFPEQMLMVLFAQLLHAASFGIFHAVSVALFHHFFSGRHHGKGQALYSSISFGAGGAFGSFYAGASWDALGPLAAYLFAAGLSFLGLLIAARWLHHESTGS